MRSILVCVLFLFLFSSASSTSAQIENVVVRTFEDTVQVNYDLVGIKQDKLSRITCNVSSDGGKTFSIFPKSVSGDIGYGVTPGSKKLIIWAPLSDTMELVGSSYVFQVVGSTYGAGLENNIIETSFIKGGEFRMGDILDKTNADENYVHPVNISDFEMSKFEITNQQFAVFLSVYGSDKVKDGEFEGETMIFEHERGLKKNSLSTNSGVKSTSSQWIPQPGLEYYPVVNVTWYGAYEYARHYGFRLPTEAEWEYAAREGGKEVRFGNGKDIANPAEINFNSNADSVPDFSYFVTGESKNQSTPVYYNVPNNLELFNLSGNVWEWCQDWYSGNYYFKSRTDNPTGPWFGKYKVIRGGSWYNNAKDIRCTDRSFFIPYRGNGDIGFRVVKEVKKKAS